MSTVRPRRRGLIASAVLVVVILGIAAWVGPRALSAKRHLEAARASLATARAALLERRLPDARAAIASAGTDTSQARRLTHDPVWWTLAHIPLAGRTFSVVATLAQSADDIARVVLPGVLSTVGDLDPHRLRGPDGTVDLALLDRVEPGLAAASAQATRADARVRDLPDSLMPHQVVAARRQLLGQANELADALRSATDAVAVAPALLGQDRPRQYFVMVQQTSESRGTGGLPGGYAVLSVDRGAIKVGQQGNNLDLKQGYVPPPPGVPSDFVDRYQGRGGFGDWRNINLSPDLPSVALMVQARWRAEHGTQLDGVISTDAIGLSDILRGSPPVDVAGGQPVPVDQLPEYLGQGQYRNFGTDLSTPADLLALAMKRKEGLTLVAQAASRRLTQGSPDPLAEIRGLVDAVSSGHLRMASQDPALAPTLAREGVDGALPSGPAPVAYPVLFNTSGSKLDYYLHRSVDYRSTGCAGGRRQTTVKVSLTSAAPSSGLPPYVAVRVVDGALTRSYVDQVDLSVFTTRGARLVDATLDGKALSTIFGRTDPVLQTSSEAGLPIWEVVADVAPGQTRTLVLHLDEPAASGAPRVPEQPLATPLLTRVDVPRC